MDTLKTKRPFTPLIRSLLVMITYIIPTMLLALFPWQQPFFISLAFIPIYLLYTWFLVKVWDKESWQVLELKINGRAIRGFLLSLILTALIVSISSFIFLTFFHSSFQKTDGLTWTNLWLGFLSAFAVQGFPEEMVYRGYMVQTLRTKYSPIISLLLSSSLFALMHIFHLFSGDVIYGLVTVFTAFSFGLLACLLKYLFKTTWAAVAVHGGFHMTRKLFELLGLETTIVSFFLYGLLFFLVAILFFYLFRERLQEESKIAE